ncbi:MAG TPA: PSD1 and planctomycete cytochrome C domain-containing protein [Pirellulaceae bacterium]|nr:PSD1 and planctomycete cytochrome C domain-containing protein [Pirellulaceae bacterium]
MRGGLVSLTLVIIGLGPAAYRLLRADESPLPAPSQRQVDFRVDVHPLLKARCFACHAGADCEAGVRLDLQAEILGETTGQPLVSVGKSGESRLIEVVAGMDEKVVMPPKGERLTAGEIGLLRAWIDQGLAWESSLLPPLEAKSDHRAFQPVVQPPIVVGTLRVASPDDGTRSAAATLNPIDAFTFARLTEAKLAPAPEADRRTLIRRLYTGTLGLLPAAGEIDTFLADEAPDAYERLVDRVLASPHYGERIGRQWLDLARYADSEGYDSNHPRPFAWLYRDYVVRAFNADKPYNEFVRQQLAGDEIEPYSDENLIATGFLAQARISSNEEDKWLQRNQMLVEVVNATGQTFLGLTINCAQCHNHKFDPITARDYYRLLGFFISGQPTPIELPRSPIRSVSEGVSPNLSDYGHALKLKQSIFETARTRRQASILEKLSDDERAALETPIAKRTRAEELLARSVETRMQPSNSEVERHIPESDRKLYDELKKKVAELEKQGAALPQTWAFYSPATSPHDLHVLPQIGFYPLPFERQELKQYRPYIAIRGDVHNIGPQVEPGWPAVLGRESDNPQSAIRNPQSRLRLAAWLTDRAHPLTARVWVNRLWQHHFGTGIVATSGDFGVQGDPPSHPELLDWLAAELMERGWSTKRIERQILTSHTYRQSSVPNPQSAIRNPQSVDPDGRLLWRFPARRLEAETLRDSLLTASGELDGQIGGPSLQEPDNPSAVRRSIYLLQKRGVPPQMQKLFDGPTEMAESCTRRHISTTALQSLYLLNSPFALKQAEAIAALIRQAAGDDQEAQIAAAFTRILGRAPDDDERQDAADFLAAQIGPDDGAADGLVLLCQTLLNTNEFCYVE